MSDFDHEWVHSSQLARNSKETPLKQDAHDPVDLATWACTFITNFRQGNPSPRQQAAINRFQSANFGDLSINFASDYQAVEAYLKVFDDMFFFGSLNDITKLSIMDSKHRGTETCASVEKIPDGNGGSTSICHIPLYSRSYMRNDHAWLLGYLLGSLLREMIHGYLTIYSCECCWDSPKGSGMGGHGEAWQRIAHGIEEAVREKLNLKLDLKRATYLASELLIGGRDMSSSEFEELGLKEERVRWHMRDFERQIDNSALCREQVVDLGWDEELNRPNELKSTKFTDRHEMLKSIIESLMKTYKRWSFVWRAYQLKRENYADDLEKLKILLESIMLMEKRWLFVWPNGSTMTSLDSDPQKVKERVEGVLGKDSKDWTFIWSPDLPQPRSEDFVDDPETLKSLAQSVMRMQKKWSFDRVTKTCELRSEDFPNDPQKLKILVDSIMQMEKKWSFVFRERDRKESL
jgi:hypothetical protein